MNVFTSENLFAEKVTPEKSGTDHCIKDLIRLFDQTFATSENTRLVRGEGEPVYLPASDEVSYHRIEFANGFFSSGLHEIAHWCVAGKARRQVEDFGYWYKPDGRTHEEQNEFEQVEVVPQAFEWVMSVAAGCPFRVSADNLSGEDRSDEEFKQKVYSEVVRRLEQGLPDRLSLFVEALQARYNPDIVLSPGLFSLENL
ncbi:hypothetical protein A9Q99_20880 [Gammaproteobacteria bacterium 45_16_T64]|nr:hypothetical protein A9Q99_20880 [Gammaproteobacteria bacterium 45_16_T64]